MKRKGETKLRLIPQLALAVAGISLGGLGAHAGTYKHIEIDGSLGDWVGVPVAYTQAQDVFDTIAYKDIYIANDEDYIYVRFTIYGSPAEAFTGLQNVFVNADNDLGTGYTSHGVASELLVQAGAGYEQSASLFNAGAINGLNWAGLPSGAATDFEFRLSRHATSATSGLPIFSSPAGFSITLESDKPGWIPTEWFPPSGGGVAYTFESAPADLTGNLPLVTRDATSWQVNATGTDLGTTWLEQGYDDSAWTGGNGLFGYTTSPGSYPAIQTALSAGANTYYFRTHFNWNYNTANIAFVVTNHLSDGAVYYLNGVEVKRVRIPAGAVAHSTAATGNASPVGTVDVFGFSGGPLVIGDNVLEVETHQAPSSSADMVFGLSFTAATDFPVTVVDASLPADVSLIGGQSATFTTDVIGSGPLAYQWLKNGTNLVGQTGSTLTIASVVPSDAGSYSLRVSNATSTNTTRAALLTVLGTPVIFTDTTKPANQFVVEGRPMTFTVAASGSAPVQYQWYLGANAIQDATNATYSIASVSPTNAGIYHVLVSNPVSATNSRNATLTVLRDTIAASVTNATAGAGGKIVLTFSEAIDATSAANLANYTVSGGVSVTGATVNGKVVTLTTGPLPLGGICNVSVNGVTDAYGNVTHSTLSVSPTILIDGSFGDWTGIAPVYSAPIGLPAAADFKDVYIYSDANYYYFRVTLWQDITDPTRCFPRFCNLHFDTDGVDSTGYLPTTGGPTFGAELMQQTNTQYQEKNGNFNDGVPPVGLDYLIAPTVRPASYPADFEWRYSRKATFGGGGLIFSTNVISVVFWGQNSSFQPQNFAPPAGGTISYTNAAPTVAPALPPGQLSITPVSNGSIALVWDQPGALQAGSSASGTTWTNVPAATSPYIVPASGGMQFFRLVK